MPDVTQASTPRIPADLPRSERPRILFYVQHLLGIGHQKRAATLTRAMEAAGLAVTFVSGGEPVRGLDTGMAEFVQLPPCRAVDKYFKVLVDSAGNRIDDAWKQRRADLLRSIVARLRPDVVMVEMFPFGRRQLRFELLPMLEAAHALDPRPAILSSVRDILVEPPKPERRVEMLERARQLFDAVLVHGDPTLVSFDQTFPQAREIADLIRYTGYVVTDRAQAGNGDAEQADADGTLPGEDEVVVSSGGGAVSEPMLRAVLGAHPLSRAKDTTWRILVGHNLPQDRFEALAADAPQGVVVERARTDFPVLLKRCRLSISQGGYNTIMEVLAANARAVMVPYAGGLETEQTLRTRLLSERGLIQTVAEDELSPALMAEAIDRALAMPRPGDVGIDMDGAENTARIVAEMAMRTWRKATS